MSNPASFEFRHIHRHLEREELIPPMPSLLEQIQALREDAQAVREEEESAESLGEYARTDEPETDNGDDGDAF